MDANEYQRCAALTAAPQNDADRAANAVLGLVGEASELAQLLIDGEWSGTPIVASLLPVIVELGCLVEPIKKAVYQGHDTTWGSDWLHTFTGADRIIGALQRLKREISSNLNLTPASLDDFDHRAFADELGDAQWYVAQGARAIGWDLGLVMQCNLKKLERRFPGGQFTPEASQDRALEYGEGQSVLGSSGVAMPFTPTLPALTGVHLERDSNLGDGYWLRWAGARTIEYQYCVGDVLNTCITSAYAWTPVDRARARAREATPTGPVFGPWSDWVSYAPQTEPKRLAEMTLPGGKRIIITSDRLDLPPLTTLHIPADDSPTPDPLPDLPALLGLSIVSYEVNDQIEWQAYWISTARADVHYERDGMSLFMNIQCGDTIPLCDRLRLRAADGPRRGPWSEWFVFTPMPETRPIPPAITDAERRLDEAEVPSNEPCLDNNCRTGLGHRVHWLAEDRNQWRAKAESMRTANTAAHQRLDDAGVPSDEDLFTRVMYLAAQRDRVIAQGRMLLAEVERQRPAIAAAREIQESLSAMGMLWTQLAPEQTALHVALEALDAE